MRRAALLLALGSGLAAAPPPPDALLLMDLRPGYTQGSRFLRNRTPTKPGLLLDGKRYRGLNCPVPFRLGYDLGSAFTRLTVKFGVLEGTAGAGVTFRVLGDGRTLAATPPLFPNAAPVSVDVPLDNVLLLEIAAEGPERARAVVVEGLVVPAAEKDVTVHLPFDAPFRPEAYPAAFRRKVNEAIDRGARFLVGAQTSRGTWGGKMHGDPMGTCALTLLAILKAGVKRDDPSVERAFAFLKPLPFERTYSVACLLMALEAKYFPGGADESDAYLTRPRLAKTLISEEDRAWIRDAAEWLVAQQGTGMPAKGAPLYPVWRYPGGGYDLSNTQYALFGLASANRCGVPTSKAWLPALRFILGVQEKDGPDLDVTRYVREKDYLHRRRERAKARGFTYTESGDAYGSMTSAGLCSLILCQQALERNEQFQSSFTGRTREGIRDALAWLEEYYDVEENVFRGKTWWRYYLFNLERAGSLLSMRNIGTRDWYRDGAEQLLAVQGQDGSFGDLVDTDFAILFLKRATVPALTNPLR